ncbi:GNAT family N-acetyltransferase [Myxosarcina sp. GI1]|uniref:GNAT family N-acetyltransferase n=1 Tax=Myxosarcina sp. GI1 TaxID=1541065 RepID=UPI000562CBAC|nr:GNAT family N-acetyltransferase [Myxosarcina sp. GI1]
MQNFDIRIATKDDLPTLNHLYADMDNKPLMSEEQITKIWQKIQQVPDYYIYLAYLEELAIGTFSLLFVPTMMHPVFHKSALLDAVTIVSSYRGRGYGKQMMREALKISAEAGCYKVTLSSNLKRDRTHKFYQSLGFKQHGWSFSYQLQSTDN